VLDVGDTIPVHSGIPNHSGVKWVQTSFYVFTVLAPSLYLISLLVLWNVPMSFVRKSYFMFCTEIINAWAALDVYAISASAALSQSQQFAKFIFEDCTVVPSLFSFVHADPENESPSDIRSNKEIAPGVDACFDLIGSFTKVCIEITFVPTIFNAHLLNRILGYCFYRHLAF
jgi:hypothetical protein